MTWARLIKATGAISRTLRFIHFASTTSMSFTSIFGMQYIYIYLSYAEPNKGSINIPQLQLYIYLYNMQIHIYNIHIYLFVNSMFLFTPTRLEFVFSSTNASH